jgi:HEPN domain-containing protein
MSSEAQAAAYRREAELTHRAARIVYHEAVDSGANLWAQVVKNGYDAIEQAVSAGIAANNEAIPRTHPGKVDAFIDQYDPPAAIEERLLTWLQRRSSSQYVDIRGDELTVPHRQFDRSDAEQILDDLSRVLDYADSHLVDDD